MPCRAMALFLITIAPALACKCPATVTACAEAATSDLVFIGTVESVAPKVLGRLKPHATRLSPNLEPLGRHCARGPD